jgi:hypothetical protein
VKTERKATNAKTKYCEDCGHAVERHKREKDRTYACDFYGCTCKVPKLKVRGEET